jgi:hypothetical protein
MSQGSGKARSGGPLPSLETLRRAYRGNATRGPEHVAGRSVAKTALLGTKLFRPDVSIAKASRWIETFTLVLGEGVMSQDELYHALRRWSRATISRDVRELIARGFLFRPEFERRDHREKWIAMDRSASYRFYVATKKAPTSLDPVGEVRERRPCHRAPADQRGRGVKPQVAVLYGPGPIVRQRRGARPRWHRNPPTWLAA